MTPSLTTPELHNTNGPKPGWLSSLMTRFLSRRTSGRKLIPEIDGLRSLAIMSVVWFHAAGNFGYYTGFETDGSLLDRFLFNLLKTGEYGVPLFFAISGFILAIPFANHHLQGHPAPSLRKYFLRRVTRLEPPYIFALTVFMLIKVLRTLAVAHDDGSLPDILAHFGASAFYLHNLIYGEASTIMVVAWSLEIEVQFYILAPLISCIFMVRSPAVRRLTLTAAIIFFSMLFGVEKPIDGRTILQQAPYFLVGLLLADFYLTDLRHNKISNAYWDAAAIACLAGVFLFKMLHFFPPIVTPWLILAGYVAVFRAKTVRRFFRATPVVIVGGMCYTIYLWHFPVIAAFRHPFFLLADPAAAWYWRLGYLFAASLPVLILGAVLFALIERPTMDPEWPRKLLGIPGRFLGTRAKRQSESE